MKANSSAIDGRVYLRRHRDSDLPLKLAPPVAASTVTVTVPRGVRRGRALLKGLFAVPPTVTRTCH
jgi:hypothetical protein